MTALRQLIHTRPAPAAWLVALAMLLKLLVPAGYMPVAAGGGVRLEICTGMGVAAPAMATMPGMAHHGDQEHPSGKAESPCGFGGLSAPDLFALPFLVAAIAPTAIDRPPPAPAASAVRPPAGLRPPPRGPPVPL